MSSSARVIDAYVCVSVLTLVFLSVPSISCSRFRQAVRFRLRLKRSSRCMGTLQALMRMQIIQAGYDLPRLT